MRGVENGQSVRTGCMIRRPNVLSTQFLHRESPPKDANHDGRCRQTRSKIGRGCGALLSPLIRTSLAARREQLGDTSVRHSMVHTKDTVLATPFALLLLSLNVALGNLNAEDDIGIKAKLVRVDKIWSEAPHTRVYRPNSLERSLVLRISRRSESRWQPRSAANHYF